MIKKNFPNLPGILSQTALISKRLFQRSFLYDHLFDLLSFFRSSIKEKRALAEWQNVAKKLFPGPLAEPSGKVLIIGQTKVEFVVLESFVLKAFEASGLTPLVLSGPGKELKEAYKAEKVTNRYLFSSFCPLPRISLAKKAFNKLSDFQSLINYKYMDVPIGKYVASTLMRILRQGNICVSDPKMFNLIICGLADSMAYVEGALHIIEKHKPKAAVFVDRGYSPSGEIYSACLLHNIPCYSWNAAHKNNTLMVKKFSQSNDSVHPSSLSQKSWNHLQNIHWEEKHTKQLLTELSQCYSNGEWYGEVGTQVNKASLEYEELKNSLGLDKQKKVAVIFSHIFWDATFFWGTDLFRDYENWFVETVKAACQNKNLNWIIKVHPANVVKNQRDGVKEQPSEILALNQYIGQLPEHVKILPADWPISTFALFKIMDYCLTVRGTVGIEAAMLGKRVLTAGTGRYDRYGFTSDFDTKEEYLKALANLDAFPLLSSTEQELAIRYAYGVFISRPLALQNFEFKFQKDAKATLCTGWKCSTNNDILEAEDLQKLALWIKSEEEDYLEVPEPKLINT